MANWVTGWRAGGRRARLLAQLAEELIQRGGDAGVGGAADADDLGWHALAPRADGATRHLEGAAVDGVEVGEGEREDVHANGWVEAGERVVEARFGEESRLTTERVLPP